MVKADARLARIFSRLKRKVPWASGAIEWLSKPERHYVRLPLAVILLVGTLLWFLPGFGLWMLPAGLLLLSIDLPQARHPTTVFIIRSERWFSKVWRSVRLWFSDWFTR